MNKKGSIGLEILVIVVVVFAMVLAAFMGKTLIDDLNADIQADSDFSNTTKATSTDVTNRFPAIFDGAIILLYVMLWIAVLISAYVIDTHPAFFIVSLIVILIVLIVAAALESSYSEIITEADFTTMPVHFPGSNFIISNLLLLTILQAFSIIAVLYGKYRAGGI